MINVFEQAITKEDGTVDLSKLMTLAPGYMVRNPQYAIPWAMDMMAQTTLSEDFIRKNFIDLPFSTLIIHNNVPQDLIEANIEAVFSKFIFGLGEEGFETKLVCFFKQGYEPHVYEKIIEMCFTYFENDELGAIEEEDIEDFSTIINAYSEAVTKEFIFKHIHDVGYFLLTCALKRDDITIDDVNERLEDVSFEEIFVWIEELGELAADDNDDAAQKYNMLMDILKSKADQSVLR